MSQFVKAPSGVLRMRALRHLCRSVIQFTASHELLVGEVEDVMKEGYLVDVEEAQNTT